MPAGKADVQRGRQARHSVFQDGLWVRGEVESDGDVRFDGKLEGRVSVLGCLTVGASGHLVADVDAEEVIVMGTVRGRIVASKRIELKAGATVEGDLVTPALRIESGVRYNGFADMSPEARETAAAADHQMSDPMGSLGGEALELG